MLRNLKISKYALIDELNIDFHQGFSVITGETGAGKSIILGAIGLILGGRADAKSIKEGADKCVIEVLFEEKSANLAKFFEENDFDNEGDECIVRREILKSGKSRAFINDTPATITQLKELGQYLVDIHSQHQNLLISGSEFQIGVLDSVAKDSKEYDAYVSAFEKYKHKISELSKLRKEISSRQEDEDYLRYSLQQLEAANLKENEQEELEREQQLLSHAEEITSALSETCLAMDGEEQGITDTLSRCADSLSRISKYLPEAESLSERLNSVCIELRDIYDELRNKADNEDYNPSRLQEVDDRLSTIYDLERKYRLDSFEELLKKTEELRSQLEVIEDCSDILEKKEKECEKLREEVTDKASVLTDKRKKASEKLTTEMLKRLKPLGMPDVKFSVEIEPLSNPEISGADSVKYLFNANKSASKREISEIASGGEIARIMLCLKAIVSEVKGLPTIIFDEIDTGVSGRIAEQMAITMQNISASGTQVICITHLPQIASKGNYHYLVYKKNEKGITNSKIEKLTEQGRLEEIAKMLSGSEITDAALENARELLNNK